MQTPFKPSLTGVTNGEASISPDDIRALSPEQLRADAEQKQKFLDEEYRIRCEVYRIAEEDKKLKAEQTARRSAEQAQREAKKRAEQGEKANWHNSIAEKRALSALAEAKTAASALAARLSSLTTHERGLRPALIASIRADVQLALDSLNT